MKLKNNRLFRLMDFRTTPCSRIVVTCLAVSAMAFSSSASATDFTWADSAGNTNWLTGASWVGGTAPANSTTTDNAIFLSVSNVQPSINALSRINGVDFQMAAGGLDFTGASTFLVGTNGIDATGQNSGTNTIAVNNIQLNSASTWNIFSNADSAGTSTFTISSTVNLNGNNLTLNGKRNSAAGNVGVINLNGVISGTANIFVYPDNFRTTTTFGALNTYNGSTNIRGTFNVNSLADTGNASALGSSGDIVIGNSGTSASLIFSGVTANSTTDRRVLFQGTSSGGQFLIANNSATGSLSFTNPDTIGGAASAATQDITIRLGGTNTGLNTFGQVIDNRSNTTGITHFQKEGAGTWALTGANTYTGTTTISAGSLQLGNGGTTGSLTATSGITNNANLAVNRSNAFTQAADLNGQIIAGTGSLTQAAAGTTTLSAANTYTGGTIVNSGSITAQNDQSNANGGWSIGPTNTATAAGIFNAGSTVVVASGKQVRIGNTSSNGTSGSTLTVAGSVTNSGTLLVGRNAALTLNNGADWSQSGDTSLTSLGGFSATLTINSGAAMTYSGSNTVKLNLNNGSLQNALLNINGTGLFTTGAGFENLASTGAGNSRVTLANSGTIRLSGNVANLTTQTQFSLGTGGGVIDNNGFSTTLSGVVTAGFGTVATGITGVGSLTSQGSGTLTLSGENTYSGNTTVIAGILTLEKANASNESSTVSIAASAVLNLTFGGTDTVDKLFLNGVQQTAGVYGSGNSGGRITGSGTLTVSSGPATGFTSWIAGFSVSGQNQPADDPDNDGMDNLVEFVLNGNPILSDNSILPKLVVTATDFEFTYQRRDDSVSPETTQTFQWGTNLASWPGSAVIPATSGTVGAATITLSPGVPNNAVTDTVKISIPKTEASGTGRLFGRLRVVKP